MGSFPTDGCTISAVSLSSSHKDVVKQVTAGDAFVNPVKGNIDGLSASISSTISLVESAGNTAIWGGLTSELTNLNTTLNSYLSHSNRISGVNLGATGPSGEPGLNGLIGIAKAYNSVCESMTGGTEDNFSPVFNSVLGQGSSQLDTEKNIVEDAKVFIQINLSLASANSGFNTGLATHVISIKTSRDVVTKLITDDNSAYNNAQNTVRDYNLGNVLMNSSNDPCFTGKLVEEIATSSLKEKLDGLS
tara:strand:- start:3149 stop:3889 length:741 start_codon:yes stop_codon:yes gene_type:complete